MDDMTMTAPGVDAWFREEGRSPFQTAVAWCRLVDAENSVNFVTGTLNHPAVEALAALRREVWNLLSEQTASDAETRQMFLDRARSYVRGEDR
jgi:hypothetical protein